MNILEPFRRMSARRRDDLARARQIAEARRGADEAWDGYYRMWAVVNHDGRFNPGRHDNLRRITEADRALERARASLARAQAGASSRALDWAGSLHAWGRLSAPSRSVQSEILAGRQAARYQRGDVLRSLRTGRLTPAGADARLADWQPYPHHRDPMHARRSR